MPKKEQYGQIYAEKFISVSLICKAFYGKMEAQQGEYTLPLNLLLEVNADGKPACLCDNSDEI